MRFSRSIRVRLDTIALVGVVNDADEAREAERFVELLDVLVREADDVRLDRVL
jgi:hypothetical protein